MTLTAFYLTGAAIALAISAVETGLAYLLATVAARWTGRAGELADNNADASKGG